jgi:hypothetical protein
MTDAHHRLRSHPSRLPSCQQCGATPPVFYSRDLVQSAYCERLCADCIRPHMPLGWKPISGPIDPPEHKEHETMTHTDLQLSALRAPAARAAQVTSEHFKDVISPFGENGRVGLSVNR